MSFLSEIIVPEISRISTWGNEIDDRRSAGETIPEQELLLYQRAKVGLFAAALAAGHVSIAEILAAARFRLRELETADRRRRGSRRRRGA